MASINIRRDITDPFYRYKMERLQSKIEGKGNGIKTVVVNLHNVADQLARPPACMFISSQPFFSSLSVFV